MNTNMFHVTRLWVIWLVVAVAALFGSETNVAAETNAHRDAPVAVSAEFTVAEDSSQSTLSITASIREGFHIYAMTQPKPFIATQIHVDESNRFQLVGDFAPSRGATLRRHESLDVELQEHEGEIAWTAPLRITADVQNEEMRISGHVLVQACTADRCLAPKKYSFVANWKPNSVVGDVARKDRPRLDFSKLEAEGGTSASLPLIVVLPMALAAGFILNFMPCVLPVIGLKVMSFAQQAGDSRRRVLILNLWYTLGMLAVFWVLGTLAVVAGLSWGQQFSSVTFNVVLASFVFVFALSFLGVWEIPIPGFVGSGKASELMQREGAAGAFSKGVLTTVLATPCSGPLLGSALTWAVIQPPLLTYLTFTFVGLGMASPYLLVGAFPKLLAFLPKPGAWMETFKQTMGFVLLATVVYLLTVIPAAYVVPVVALIIGLGAACWWIGRSPVTANRQKKIVTWGQATAMAAVVGFIAFGWLHGIMESRFQRAVDRELAQRRTVVSSMIATADDTKSTTPVSQNRDRQGNELPWQSYSRALLEKLTADGKTVLVAFTADWCLTCKTNEAVALNTTKTKQLVDSNRVVTLKADKTRPAPEVDELLKLLGNKAGSIPFYAVFPAENPNRPILIDGLFTSPQPILDALKKAGPSRTIVIGTDENLVMASASIQHRAGPKGFLTSSQ